MPFLFWKDGATMNVYCVKCGRKVADYPDRGTMPIVVRCRNCGAFSRFDPVKKSTKRIKEPHRAQASGARFY